MRRFPSFLDAAGHALLGASGPDNPFTRRYNAGTPGGDAVGQADWVSGSCFLVRRGRLEELGGFDERYFMYAEDMDLCWRAHQAGWGVGTARTAVVTHVQGVAPRRHPYRMWWRTTAPRCASPSRPGWRRAVLPLACSCSGLRMAMATVRLAVTR